MSKSKLEQIEEITEKVFEIYPESSLKTKIQIIAQNYAAPLESEIKKLKEEIHVLKYGKTK